jgi:hypothetical protein
LNGGEFGANGDSSVALAASNFPSLVPRAMTIRPLLVRFR